MIIPRPEHPRPDFIRPLWMSLNGEWQFAFDDEEQGFTLGWHLPGTLLNRTIMVPFCYQCEMSGIHDNAYHAVLWYRRSFTLPEAMRGKTILLRFGAVDYSCQVFVNGQMAGEHTGGYTPFTLDITRFAADRENDLCIRVEDRRNCTQPRGKQNWKDQWFACWYTPVSGIWQSVYLEATGSCHIRSAHVTPDIDSGTASLDLALSTEPASPIEAAFTLCTRGRLIKKQSVTLASQNARIVFDMVESDRIEGFSVWEPGSPELYDLSMELVGYDQVDTYFGMRKVDVKDGWVLLNNRPLYQRLVLDQGYWLESLLTPPSDEAIRTDIEWALKLGYNGARKHQKLEDPRYYYWADKLGLLVWGEIPSAYTFYGETVKNLSSTLEGFIDRDFNHPCIITWVPLNESWGVNRIYQDKRMQATANMLYYQAKALDGTRLVSSNDGWEQMKTDICALHDYSDSGDVLSKHFADRSFVEAHACDQHMTFASGETPAGKEAFLVTEYGGIAFDEGDGGTWGYHDKVRDEDAFFARFKSATDAVRKIPYCQGYCYTQLTDVQQETNGLLYPDRRPKIEPDRFRAINRNPDGRYT